MVVLALLLLEFLSRLFVMQYEALVLGVAQDGGCPHMGCECKNCSSFSLPGKEQLAVSLALIQRDQGGTGKVWLIDCGPDIKAQWRMLAAHPVPLTPPNLPTKRKG